MDEEVKHGVRLCERQENDCRDETAHNICRAAAESNVRECLHLFCIVSEKQVKTRATFGRKTDYYCVFLIS